MQAQISLAEEKLINIVRTLPPTGVEELLDFALFIQSKVTEVDRMTEDQFEQELVQLGLLKKFQPPTTASISHQNRTPIEIQGKPLSEILIEERR